MFFLSLQFFGNVHIQIYKLYIVSKDYYSFEQIETVKASSQILVPGLKKKILFPNVTPLYR